MRSQYPARMQDSNYDLEKLRRFAERLADEARKQTLPRFRMGGAIFNKAGAGFDPVTDADREAERKLREIVSAQYPSHGVIGEEFSSHNADAEWRWVIDPVDGTRAFVCGIATWTTLIALERGARPVIGVIDQPFTNERWIGAAGEAYFRSGSSQIKCRTSGVRTLSEARVSTTDPRHTGYFSAAEAEAFGEVADAARFARFSLDAYAYGLLALGELDLVIESSLKHHDIAALIPVVEGAGGVLTDWRGAPPGSDDRGRVIAAASSELHSAALEFLRRV